MPRCTVGGWLTCALLGKVQVAAIADPGLSMLRRFAKALGVDVKELLGS